MYKRQTIASREDELEHRRDIEARFEDIVARETANRDDAERERAAADQQHAEILAKLANLKEQLEDMREKDSVTERYSEWK